MGVSLLLLVLVAASDPELEMGDFGIREEQGLLTRISDLWSPPVILLSEPKRFPTQAVDEWEELASPEPLLITAEEDEWSNIDDALSDEEKYVIEVEHARSPGGTDYLRFVKVASSLVAATGAAIAGTDEYIQLTGYAEDTFPLMVKTIKGIPVDKIKSALSTTAQVVVPVTVEAASVTADVAVFTVAVVFKSLQLSGRAVMFVANSGIDGLKHYTEGDHRRFRFVKRM